jgi:hypothetical protein
MELFTFEYLLLAAFLVVFKAVPDGLMVRSKNNTPDIDKRQRLRYWADSMYFIYHAVISLMLILSLTDYCRFNAWILQYPSNLYKVIAGFLMFRFGLFDPILNIAAGEPINYVGFTKRWDKVIRWLCDKTKCPVEYLLFIRLCIAGMGIGWLITANRP